MLFSKKIFFIFLTLTTLALSLVYYGNSKNTSFTPSSREDWLKPDNISKVQAHWKKVITKIGPNKAYQEFLDTYQSADFGTQHLASHIIGELLYSAAGIDAITICDTSFAFGCYHSTFSQAIATNGLDILKDLDEACESQYGPFGIGCQHGIGHGLGEYYAHQKINDQLHACKLLNWKAPYLGCSGGVFMEHNFPIELSDTNAEFGIRPMDDPHAPCNQIDTYQKSCYFEIAQWWEVVMNKDYKLVDEHCSQAPSSILQEACYLGMGSTIAPSANYDLVEISNRCNQISSSENKSLCFAGAAWMSFATPEYKPNWKSICDLAPSKITCLKKADIVGAITLEQGEYIDEN